MAVAKLASTEGGLIIPRMLTADEAAWRAVESRGRGMTGGKRDDRGDEAVKSSASCQIETASCNSWLGLTLACGSMQLAELKAD